MSLTIEQGHHECIHEVAIQEASLLLNNVTLFDPFQSEPKTTNVLIKNGIIHTISEIQINEVTPTYDMKGAWLTPQFIDIGTQLREPGFEHKGTMLRESQAAYRSGFSTLAMLPNTLPVIDTPAVLGLVQELANKCPLHIASIAAITQGLEGKQLSEVFALREAGCVALTQSRKPFQDNRTLLRCLEYCSTANMPVIFYSQDPDLVADGIAHEGPIADKLGLAGIPACAETTAIARDLLLIERTGVRAHFGHISCAKSVELIVDAKNKGLNVSADVALTHLAFDEQSLIGFNPLFHLEPPLRSQVDRKALLQAVNSGDISLSIGHQPQDIASKTAPFAEAASGMSLYDVHIGIAQSLIEAGELNAMAWVKSLSLGPAALLQQPLTGIYIGDKARFNIIDTKVCWTPNKQNCLSMGGNIFGFHRQQQGRLIQRMG